GLDRSGKPGEVFGERAGVEPVRPVDNDRIESRPLVLQVAPVGMERHGFGNAARRLRRAGEAAHPDAVGPEQMVERGVDRAEERAALAPPLAVGQAVGDRVQVLVLPAIVTRHALDIAEIDHACSDDREHMTEGRGPKEFSQSVVSRLSSVLRYATAALAFSTIAANAAGSRIARSDSTLRSTNIPALSS